MKHQLGRLQRAQNTAARIISGKKWRDHITQVLRELHWLPVEERVCYKILMQTSKCMNGLAPSYLSNMLNLHSPARALRSADNLKLRLSTGSAILHLLQPPCGMASPCTYAVLRLSDLSDQK
jgi:hypothetical protein